MSHPDYVLERLAAPTPDFADVPVDPLVVRPPAPGAESAGPPISPLVVDVRQAVRAELALFAQARITARARQQSNITPGATDGSGNACLELLSVPGGATGRLVWATIEEAGVTPAAPDTSATMWHAIYWASSRGIDNPARVIALGGLLDFRLSAPTRGDAMIPDVYSYADIEAAPTLVGPATFYLVVQGATATRQLASRWTVFIEQPE